LLHLITFDRTPLDEESAQRRELYLTTHNTHNRQTYVPPSWFEPAIPASEWPQTDALDRVATGLSSNDTNLYRYIKHTGLSRNINFSQEETFYSIGPIFKDQVVLEDGTIKLSRNVGSQLPTYAA